MRSAAIAILVLAGCQAPTITVESTPAGSQLHRDGLPIAQPTPHAFETPYYGKVYIEEDPPETDIDRYWRAQSTMVDMRPPLPPWLFPFDFAIDLGLWLFGDNNRRIEVTLERQPPVELTPKRVLQLKEAARTAAVER